MVANEKIVSPDGRFVWDGKRWIETPKGTIQSFMWDGEKWGSIPAGEGGAILSPDGDSIWTGTAWIPSPPNDLQNSYAQKKIISLAISPMQGFGNHNKEITQQSPKESAWSAIALVFTFLVTTSLFSSQIIQPLLYDASIVRVGRYAMSMDAWETIEEDEATSVVAIGSSMIQYALNGSCIEDEIGNQDTFVYNIAIPGSMPYMEMIQTEAAVRASPELVLLEVGPNSLWDVDQFSTESLMDYFELRLTILSLMLESQDEGGWLEILRQSELDFLDKGMEQNFRSESVYADDAIEEFLRRLILSESSAPREISAAYVPHPSHDSWHEYLRTQNWLYSKLELMSNESRSDWENITIPNSLKKGVNNPEHNGTLNHAALEYMVSRFSESGINTILVSPPLHPIMIENLAPGQYEGHNTTLTYLSEYDGVTTLNLIWEDYWIDNDFFDHNHLDRHGRHTFCQKASPIIKTILES